MFVVSVKRIKLTNKHRSLVEVAVAISWSELIT